MNDEAPYLISYWNPKTSKAALVCVIKKYICSPVPLRFLRRSARFISKEHQLLSRLKGTSMCRVGSGQKVRRLHLTLRNRNTSLFSSCDMSQSSHGYLMTQEFCYTALVTTTCDFQRLTSVG